jgi:MFS family permease
MSGKKVVLAVMCIAQLTAAMAGYNYSPILPVLLKEWSLTAASAGMLASASQAGYVAAVIPCGFLSDRFSPRLIFILGTLEASIASLGFAFLAHDFSSAMVLRFLIGIGTGALYVPGLKILTRWFPSREIGKAVGIYTSCAAIAQATLLYVMAPITIGYGWQWAVIATSMWGVLGAIIVLTLVKERPQAALKDAGFQPVLQPVPKTSSVKKELFKKPVILLNLSYMGHMWEYIAFNAWIGPFMVAVALAHGFQSNPALVYGNAIAATAIMAEAVAVGIGGFVSDKIGRTRTIMTALLVSAACSLSIGWLINFPWLGIIVIVALVAGFFVIMDSAVFKAGVSELVEREYSGAILGIQSFLGFGIGVISPTVFGWVLGMANPGVVGSVNFKTWGWSFGVLGMGALTGILTAFLLRRTKESALMAGGRK